MGDVDLEPPAVNWWGHLGMYRCALRGRASGRDIEHTAPSVCATVPQVTLMGEARAPPSFVAGAAPAPSTTASSRLLLEHPMLVDYERDVAACERLPTSAAASKCDGRVVTPLARPQTDHPPFPQARTAETPTRFRRLVLEIICVLSSTRPAMKALESKCRTLLLYIMDEQCMEVDDATGGYRESIINL